MIGVEVNGVGAATFADESSKLTMVNSAGFSDGRRVVGGLAVGESVTGLIVVCSIVGSLLGAGVGDLLGLGVVGFLVGFGVGGRHEVKLKQVIPAEKMQSSLSLSHMSISVLKKN